MRVSVTAYSCSNKMVHALVAAFPALLLSMQLIAALPASVPPMQLEIYSASCRRGRRRFQSGGLTVLPTDRSTRTVSTMNEQNSSFILNSGRGRLPNLLHNAEQTVNRPDFGCERRRVTPRKEKKRNNGAENTHAQCPASIQRTDGVASGRPPLSPHTMSNTTPLSPSLSLALSSHVKPDRLPGNKYPPKLRRDAN